MECQMSDHQHNDESDKQPRTLEFTEKAHKLIDHWIRHNDDHAHSYRQWADSFRGNGLDSAAALLDSAAELTRQINLTLVEASHLVDS